MNIDRPTQITTILRTLTSGDNAEISDELESYIADLEAKQPDRPARITEILSIIGSQNSADVSRSLEAYISDLEVRQQIVLPANDFAPSRNPDKLPIWSYQRVLKREQRRRESALKKQNNYR